MSNQAAKHHRKAARHERAARNVKRVRGGKPNRAKKLVTRDDRAAGEAHAAPDTVAVMEIEVVSFPEDRLEVDEAEPSLPQDSFFEEEE